MPIWFKDYSIDEVNKRGKGTMVEHLGIEVLDLDQASITGRMPVDHRTKQPIGLLHGGASAAFAETLASTAANLVVDRDQEYCVGLEINANHISSCKDGFVLGVASPLHLGRSTQVWEIRITQEDRLVCVSRMTMAVLKRPNGMK